MMKGTEEAIIPLIPLEANQLPKYSNEPSTIQKQVISAQYMNNGNTSISSDPTLAMFSRNKFVNVKNLNAKLDIDPHFLGEQDHDHSECGHDHHDHDHH